MSFYEKPWFIDTLLISIYVMLAATLCLTVWSMVRAFRQRIREPQAPGLPTRLISWGVFALLITTLGLTCLTASTKPLLINGELFDNRIWLRMSDMLINSSAILIVVAVICAALGMMGIGRKLKN